MPKGYLALVLHAHLPYVRHPEDEGYLEERWLFEGITECYLPILSMLEGLHRDGVPCRLTISLSPTLISMLDDRLLQRRYIRHLKNLVDLAGREVQRTANQPEFRPVAEMYRDLYQRSLSDYKGKYGRDLVLAFKRFQDLGLIEVITCGATHGFLPLLELHPEAVKAQIGVAVDLYRRRFGRNPSGFWLPECAYTPGIDDYLAEHGIGYFFLETHGLTHADPAPRYSVFAPVRCKSGVAAFARDPECSKQVWSSIEGYPGDYSYREFHRDIGFDLDWDYVGPYLGTRGVRGHTGIKYYRITGPTDWKEPYRPGDARETAARHAGNFMFNRERQIEYLAPAMDRPPILVAPFDAELFGHWWFEGPMWLDFLVRKVAYDQDVFKLATPGDYLSWGYDLEQCTPSASTWGYQGYNDVWLDGSNQWIYRHLHAAQGRMINLVRQFPESEGVMRRALNQAARELLLAQASDWAFIMKAGTMVDYARKRFEDHIRRFTRLYEEITRGRIDQKWLGQVESVDNIFPDIDYRVYAPVGG